jgi:hypothetical protein
MKITQATLKAIIKEEVAKMFEEADKNTGMSGVDGDDDGKTYMGHEKADAIKEETADHREDHNIDDLYAMVRNLERKVDGMSKK